MKSNFNKMKRWASKSSKKRKLFEERFVSSKSSGSIKTLDIAKIVQTQESSRAKAEIKEKVDGPKENPKE
jgi:hypothetical protein